MSEQKLNKKEALLKIKEVDVDLGVLRESWMSANPKEKWKHARLINKSLDERLTYMKIRDEK